MKNKYNDASYQYACLMTLAAQGDRYAFDKLVTQNYPLLRHMIADEFCESEDEKADDLLQQVLMDTFQNPSRFNEQTSFVGMIMQATRDYVSAQDLSPELNFTAIEEEGSEADITTFLDALAEHENPSGILDRQQAVAALRSIVLMASVSCNKHAKGLSYLFDICVEGRSLEEVADRENSTAEKVGQAIERACASHYPSLSVILAP